MSSGSWQCLTCSAWKYFLASETRFCMSACMCACVCTVHVQVHVHVHVVVETQRLTRIFAFSANCIKFPPHLRVETMRNAMNRAESLSFAKGGASPDQLHGSICSLCILLQECILYRYISPHATRETVSPTLRSTAMTSTCRIPL